MGYYHQDGIVGGNYDRSNYSRLSLRSNTSYTLFDDTKDRDWLNKLQISANISYSRSRARPSTPTLSMVLHWVQPSTSLLSSLLP